MLISPHDTGAHARSTRLPSVQAARSGGHSLVTVAV
ncbi:hypothetical protein EDF35_2737 [Rathayibacter sp. PhB151]|nr:hypothetical protein EDF35_2737 [Rathayibacter sp. PhB151]